MENKESREFVRKLYDIIENDQYRDCIRWSDDGSSFYITNVAEFANRVLKNRFRHNNINSFIRQLNKYDFHKKKCSIEMTEAHGPNLLEFEHVFFQRGSKHQLYKIKRKKTSQEETLQSYELMPGIENTLIFQSHVVSTIKSLTEKFNIILDNMNDIKRKLSEIAYDKHVANKSVLIYDEDINMAMHIYSLLKDQKLSITIVDSRNNLCNILKHNIYDFIIISAAFDLVKNAVKFFRRFNFITPVIYVGNEKLELDFITLGITEFIKKPFTYADFFHTIKKYLPR